MKRLTKRAGNSVVYSEFNSNNSDGCYEMMNNCLHKLADYEDAEEQGLLLKLPCKGGDTVYSVTRDFISEYTICSIEMYKEGFFFNWKCEKGIYINLRGFTNFDIGKTVFLTKEEAEQALAGMEGD